MINPHETDARGRLLEELYEACMALPADQRDPFIVRNANGDVRLISQLRAMVLLPDPLGANPLSTTTTPRTSPSFELPSGTVFGDCQIVSEIGAGAMGAVYLARDLKNFNRLVALKVMKPSEIQPHDLERFADETAALSRLVHPHIAQFYYRGIQHWQGSDRPFLVMEYVDGQTLDDYLAGNKPAENQIIELLRKICIAVHHGHLKGVFHRDMKPSNILITPDGEPKIIDFGVSFMVSTEPATGVESKLKETVGTLLYMAPETAGGQPFTPDPQTDVYSLGVIAFEAFATRRPGVLLPSNDVEFLEPPLTKEQVRRRIAECEREKLRSANRSFSSDLECVISKSLNMKKENRYGDAAEFAEDLRRLLNLEPIHARPPSRFYTAKMFARRNRLAVAAGTIVFIAILAAAIIFRRGENRVHAELTEKTAALNREAAAKAEIQRQYAASRLRSGQFAEQRGNWRIAAEEYHAATEANTTDRLTAAVGEVRSLERMGNFKDSAALIQHIYQTMPDIAQLPEFQLVEGLVYWSTKPAESVQRIKTALLHRDHLNRADRAFAEASITDDVKVFAPKLRETVEADPFNRDAWALLALTDFLLGDAPKCEHDSAILHGLYPEDQVAPALAACAAAFQGRHADAISYLDNATALPRDLKQTMREVVDFVGTHRSFDDYSSFDVLAVAPVVAHVMPFVTQMRSSKTYPEPVMFKHISAFFQKSPLTLIGDPQQLLADMDTVIPNGLGESIAGVLANNLGDYPAAVRHLETSLITPSLVDRRRRTAFILTIARCNNGSTHGAPASEIIDSAKRDLDQLISFGGVRADIYPHEEKALQTGHDCGLAPQVRTLALGWLTRSPENPNATYYLAWADARLDDRQTAAALYKRAIEKGLKDELKTDALSALRTLTAPAATRPSTNHS